MNGKINLKKIKLYALSLIITLFSMISIENERLAFFSIYNDNNNDLQNNSYYLEKDNLNIFSFFNNNKTEEVAPEHRPENTGDIYERFYQYKAGVTILKNNGAGLIRNVAGRSVQEINSIISQEPSFKIELNSKVPQVLIMHTHTTESFEKFDLGYYDPNVPTRSDDENLNVLAVGQSIKSELERAGINTVQDREIHDREYSNAYARSRESVKSYLEKFPSIKIVLDIHRDAITDENNARYKPTAIINDKKAAQVMIISGTTGKGVELPNYAENLKFASRLQDSMEKTYPGLTRPILFDFRHYNQDLTTGSLLVEVGSQANTISEVVYSGQLIGISLSNYLRSISS